MTPLLALLAAAALALAPASAEAQSYRCVGKDGKKYYGQNLPPQCLGQPVEQLNAQGMVIKRIDPQASAVDRAQREVEAEQKKKRDAALKEENRRNKALLATYTSEKDIEMARKRALADNEVAVKEINARIAKIKKDQADMVKELEFYQGKNKPPATLEQKIKNAEIDLKAQESLRAAKTKEVDSINAKYDDDKKRYLELTRGGSK
jgi:plasmid stability protein